MSNTQRCYLYWQPSQSRLSARCVFYAKCLSHTKNPYSICLILITQAFIQSKTGVCLSALRKRKFVIQHLSSNERYLMCLWCPFQTEMGKKRNKKKNMAAASFVSFQHWQERSEQRSKQDTNVLNPEKKSKIWLSTYSPWNVLPHIHSFLVRLWDLSVNIECRDLVGLILLQFSRSSHFHLKRPPDLCIDFS